MTEPKIITGDYFTDASLAQHVADEVLGADHLWTTAMGWMAWNGCVWASVQDESVIERVRLHIVSQYAVAVRMPESTDRDAEIKGWRGAESRARLAAITGLCRGILIETADVFDSDPDILNTPRGVVDLRTGAIMAPDPKRRVTKCTAVAYVPGAVHPDWFQALTAVPADAQGWYALRKGQAITGYIPDDDVVLLEQGGGSNGKSTIVEAITSALGDYFTVVPDKAILGDPRDHTTELMAFRGVRYAQLEETAESRHLNPVRLKKLAGTGSITARALYKDNVTFKTTHSLFINTNHRPRVNETDHGTWRRLALVPFTTRYRKPGEPLTGPADAVGDPGLRGRMSVGDEGRAEAVLAWLVWGAMQWYQLGRVMPPHPPSVVAATNEWRKESDVVLGWLEEFLEFSPDHHVSSTELLAAVNESVVANGGKAWSAMLLAARLQEHELMAEHSVSRCVVRKGSTASGELSARGFMGWQPSGADAKQYKAWYGLRFRY